MDRMERPDLLASLFGSLQGQVSMSLQLLSFIDTDGLFLACIHSVNELKVRTVSRPCKIFSEKKKCGYGYLYILVPSHLM